MKKENIIRDKSFAFALSIIDLSSQLNTQKEYVISIQILRCGTSIGANVEESTAAQSRKDFISKLSIASKEARETRYWLRLIEQSDRFSNVVASYLDEVDEIIRILTAIVKTSRSTN